MSEITILTAARTLQGAEIRSSLDKRFADLYHDLDNGQLVIPLPSTSKSQEARYCMKGNERFPHQD